MPRGFSARTDITDPDIDSQMENELLQNLKKEYRKTELNRNGVTEMTKRCLQKLRYEISILEAERQEMMKEYQLAESLSNYRKDCKNSDHLMSLAVAKDTTKEEIQKQRDCLASLEREISTMNKKLKDEQQASGGLQKTLNHSTVMGKQIRVLENRLDQALKKFNQQLTENKYLRQDIDIMRTEKEKFDGLHHRLEKEYAQIRQQISQLIEGSTQAYSTREEAQNRISTLKEKLEKDIQQHHADMKELERIIDHDRKLRNFMGLKARERLEDHQLVAWRQKKESLEADKKMESQEDSVERYEMAVQKIKEMTGEDNLDLDVPRFIEVEDRNFALFNYVNEMNNEIEMLQDQMKEIRNEIEDFENQGAQLDSERKKILNDLEEMQMEVRKDIQVKEEMIKEITKIFDQLKIAVKDIFLKINCDSTPITDMLGSSMGVSELNMIQYLGLIEQRANEVLAMQVYLQSKDQKNFDPRGHVYSAITPKSAHSQVSIFPPSIGDEYQGIDESDVGEEDLKPLTRSDLELRVIKTAKKREEDAQKEESQSGFSIERDKNQKHSQKKESKKDRT